MSWNIHRAGEILREEFMKPLGLSARKLAKLLAISAPRIYDVLLESRGVSSETAFRVAHYFDTTPKFWLNMQISYELKKAEDELKIESSRLPTNPKTCDCYQ